MKSVMMTLLADVRLRPRPPARVEMRKTLMLGSLLNLSTSAWRLSPGVLPSKRRNLYWPLNFVLNLYTRFAWMMSSIDVHWLNTST